MNRIAAVLFFSLAVAALAAPVAPPAARPTPPPDDLAAPAMILCGDAPIDVDVGHAMPAVTDWDRDGKRDLLVGQFGDGKLRFYRNEGTDAAPKFGKWDYVKAGADLARVPTG